MIAFCHLLYINFLLIRKYEQSIFVSIYLFMPYLAPLFFSRILNIMSKDTNNKTE